MERNALRLLEKWKDSPRRKPMIVWGARQVGKTYLLLNLFAERNYPSRTIYIDFRVEKQISAFCSETVNAKEIIEFISLYKNREINRDTLLIFDEIQECPAIITSLKYFCQDFPEIPVIATGSMVRIKIRRMENKPGSKNENGFLFPIGKINQITLYPMTFGEYLMNANPFLYGKIQTAYAEKEPLPNQIHEIAMDSFMKYLLVGGMPEALSTYIETDNLLETRNVLKDLYDNYLSDMELYQASPESVVRARRVFTNIYKELNRDSKNFSPSLIEEKTRGRDYRTSLDWLSMAHIVHRSYQLKEHVTLPLLSDNESLFRLYLGDIGMFSYQSGINPTAFISKEGRNSLSGIFFENYAAMELAAHEIPLYFWKGKNDAEMEFVVENNGVAIPIDVKKKHGTLNSLTKFRQHNSKGIAVKVSQNNYGYHHEQQLLTLPFYAFFLFAEEISEGNFTGLSY